MDKKQKGKIINALRKLTYSYPARANAKKKQKVAPATFECELCGIWIYEGSRELETLDLSPPKGLVKGKCQLDHKEPVIAITGFSQSVWNWHEYIERLFCEEEGFQCICKSCHDAKTKDETEQRKQYRRSKKK